MAMSEKKQAEHDKTSHVKRIRIKKIHIILLLILLLGFSARFAGFLREAPVSYHPDGYLLREKIEAMLTFSDRRNTSHYAWPGETIYSAYAILFLLLQSMGFEISSTFITKALQFNSILFGTLTIYAVYVLTKRLYSTRAALFASALFSVLMYHVVISHFETADATVIFFMTLFYIALIPLIQKRYLPESPLVQGQIFSSGKLRINKTILFIATILVLSIFTKWTGLTLLYPLVAAIILHFGFLDDIIKDQKIRVNKVKAAVRLLGTIAIFAIIVSMVVWPAWPFQFEEISQMMAHNTNLHKTGHFGIFPTAGKGMLDFELSVFPILRASVGIAFTVLAFAAMLFCFVRKRKEDLFIASSALVYLLFIGMYPVRLNRYYVVILPLLAVMAGVLLDVIIKNRKKIIRIAGWGLFIITFVMSAALSTAYVSILVNEDVRVTAGEWIENNIPYGSSIMVAPYSLSHALPVFSYNNYNMNSQAPDYIILPEPNTFVYRRYFNNRELFRDEDWRNNPPKDEVLQFYDAIYSEQTEYKLTKVFHVTPKLGLYTYTENKGLLYDIWSITHPEVRIYKRSVSSQV